MNDDTIGGRVHRRSPLVDADLCRRLQARGSARGTDGLPDLRKALDLVAGAPFDQLGDRGCEWLLDARLDREHLALIADISSKVVTLELAPMPFNYAAVISTVAGPG